ncbi:hypothetical protein Tcan_01692, partial [Toxocara canis]
CAVLFSQQKHGQKACAQHIFEYPNRVGRDDGLTLFQVHEQMPEWHGRPKHDELLLGVQSAWLQNFIIASKCDSKPNPKNIPCMHENSPLSQSQKPVSLLHAPERPPQDESSLHDTSERHAPQSHLPSENPEHLPNVPPLQSPSSKHFAIGTHLAASVALSSARNHFLHISETSSHSSDQSRSRESRPNVPKMTATSKKLSANHWLSIASRWRITSTASSFSCRKQSPT